MKSILLAVLVSLVVAACGGASGAVDRDRMENERIANENTGRDALSDVPIGDITAEEERCVEREIAERGVDMVELIGGSAPQQELDQYFDAIITCIPELERLDVVTVNMAHNMSLIAGVEVTTEDVECLLVTARERSIDIRPLLYSTDMTQEDLRDMTELVEACFSDEQLIALGVMAADESLGYGTYPELDELYDACGEGDDRMCDILYWESPLNSGYETFAASCGERATGDGYCSLSGVPSAFAEGIGDDEDLDALARDCQAEDLIACDLLYLLAPLGSEYFEIADTCAGRLPLGAVPNCRFALK